jgi:hypothetical protein
MYARQRNAWKVMGAPAEETFGRLAGHLSPVSHAPDAATHTARRKEPWYRLSVGRGRNWCTPAYVTASPSYGVALAFLQHPARRGAGSTVSWKNSLNV